MIRSEAPPSPQHYYILDDVRVGSILDIDFLGGSSTKRLASDPFPEFCWNDAQCGGRGLGGKSSGLLLF